MYYLSSDGVRIYYETHGNKNSKAVLMVHGFGASVDMYKHQVEDFVDNGYFVILLDVRNHGKSDKVSIFNYDDIVQDIIGILKELEITKTFLIGVSMGGNIAMKFAVQAESYLEGLVICDSFAGIDRLKFKFLVWIMLLTLKYKSIEKLAKGYITTYTNLGSEELGHYFANQVKKMDRKDLVKIRKVINNFSIKSELITLKVPTLVLTGDAFGDWFVEFGREISNEIEGSQFKVISGGGDPSNYVKHKIFNTEVINFLKNIK